MNPLSTQNRLRRSIIPRYTGDGLPAPSRDNAGLLAYITDGGVFAYSDGEVWHLVSSDARGGDVKVFTTPEFDLTRGPVVTDWWPVKAFAAGISLSAFLGGHIRINLAGYDNPEAGAVFVFLKVQDVPYFREITVDDPAPHQLFQLVPFAGNRVKLAVPAELVVSVEGDLPAMGVTSLTAVLQIYYTENIIPPYAD